MTYATKTKQLKSQWLVTITLANGAKLYGRGKPSRGIEYLFTSIYQRWENAFQRATDFRVDREAWEADGCPTNSKGWIIDRPLPEYWKHFYDEVDPPKNRDGFVFDFECKGTLSGDFDVYSVTIEPVENPA